MNNEKIALFPRKNSVARTPATSSIRGMSIPMKYPMKQYLNGIVEALKAAPGNGANSNDVETIRFYGELGNDVPDSQWPLLM